MSVYNCGLPVVLLEIHLVLILTVIEKETDCSGRTLKSVVPIPKFSSSLCDSCIREMTTWVTWSLSSVGGGDIVTPN